ncbi:MAG TPA: FtsQ-type POTRA domain-containing protein, partial [Gaiellaceae bacterium]|nr:FtsQ-type POTRA domain-containing protein [Gaiellaceae bacterium]
MAAKRRGRQPRARAAAVALPRARQLPAPARRARLVPSRRSLGIGLAILAVTAAAYAAARESSVFAVRSVEVSGVPPALRAQVRAALAPLLGTSLLALDGAAVERRVEALPAVLSAGYDRAFPHTLRVIVVPEKPVAVLRRGTESWLVSARGRVISRVPRGSDPALPRIWVPTAAGVLPGAFLDATHGGTAARSLALVADRFPARIAVASFAGGDLTFRLRSGLELRLGDATDVRLKLAVARR